MSIHHHVRRAFPRGLSSSIATLIIAASAGMASSAAVHAEDSALLEALVRKHILSEKEAAQIQEENAKQEQTGDANKIKLSSAVSELKIYGDIRERYQYDEVQSQFQAPNAKGKTVFSHGNQESRWRFRLRLDADFKLGEQWFGGVELATNSANDSSMQTYGGEFGKYSIYISKAYLGYKPADWITFEIGKFSNPFYTTDLLWDPDINPDGVYEQIQFHKLFASGSSAPAASGYSKDGKNVKEVAPLESPWELTLVAGQLFYNDNVEGGAKTNPTTPTDPGTTDSDTHNDAYVFETQLIASYKTHGVKFTIAPAWFVESAGALSTVGNSVSFVDSAAVSGASRKFNTLLLPGDISFQIAGIKTKLYWDAAYNFEGAGRYNSIYELDKVLNANGHALNSHSSHDNLAWLAGIQLGQNAKAGDLSLLANWRQTGIASVDPNLNDSDFALGYLNTQGYKVGLAYNLTNFAVFQVTWYQAWNLRKNLIGGEATGDNAVANANSVKVLQVDLNVKF